MEVREMLAVAFLATTVICAVGWLTWYISTAAVLYYIEKKGYIPPNDLEIKECIQWVVKQMLRR